VIDSRSARFSIGLPCCRWRRLCQLVFNYYLDRQIALHSKPGDKLCGITELEFYGCLEVVVRSLDLRMTAFFVRTNNRCKYLPESKIALTCAPNASHEEWTGLALNSY
jgi:hypothetical protein